MKYLLIILFSFFLFAEAQAGVAVVVNKNSSINKVDKATLLELYKLNVKKLDGKSVKLVSQIGNSIAEKFFSALGTDESQIKKVWLKKKLTGGGKPPAQKKTDEDVINEVSSNTDALGFVDSAKAGDKVKVILVIE